MVNPSILSKRTNYQPFEYPWAYNAWYKQQKMHWLPEEVALREDVADWNRNLSTNEKNLLTQIFRFFTQADIDVAYAYNHIYQPIFAVKPEITMMLSSFANMESIHIAAYAHLLNTIGMPETEFKAFQQYKAMMDKHEYIKQFNPFLYAPHTKEFKEELARSLAVYSAFTEGLQLFSSFVILLNFTRFNKMKGMGQIVTWSIRDESLHVDSMIKLTRTFIEENKRLIWTDEFKKTIYDICRKMVELEDSFIDLAFEQGGIEGLTPDEVKQYIRYIADRRLLQLGLKPNFKVKDNPLEWVDYIINAPEHTNFFENRPTTYAKAAVTGWDEI